jgi:hypothetical protein
MVLKGKILKILDSKRVIVNLGIDDEVKKEMKFFIYELGEEIRDPDTNEVIERLEIVKHRLRVVHIQEKFSIMRSNEYTTPFIAKLFAPTPSQQIREIKPFLLKDQTDEKDGSILKKAIKIGDLVREDVN